jgi:hypothetical protein
VIKKADPCHIGHLTLIFKTGFFCLLGGNVIKEADPCHIRHLTLIFKTGILGLSALYSGI